MKKLISISAFIVCFINAKAQHQLELKQFPPLKFQKNIPYKSLEFNLLKVTPTFNSELYFQYPFIKAPGCGFIPNSIPLNANECKILVYIPTQNMQNTSNHIPNAFKENILTKIEIPANTIKFLD